MRMAIIGCQKRSGKWSKIRVKDSENFMEMEIYLQRCLDKTEVKLSFCQFDNLIQHFSFSDLRHDFLHDLVLCP